MAIMMFSSFGIATYMKDAASQRELMRFNVDDIEDVGFRNVPTVEVLSCRMPNLPDKGAARRCLLRSPRSMIRDDVVIPRCFPCPAKRAMESLGISSIAQSSHCSCHRKLGRSLADRSIHLHCTLASEDAGHSETSIPTISWTLSVRFIQ